MTMGRVKGMLNSNRTMAVDGVDVRKSNKRVDLSAVKAHLFKVDY